MGRHQAALDEGGGSGERQTNQHPTKRHQAQDMGIGDGRWGGREQRDIIGALTGEPGSMDKITEYFFQKTREVITQESNTLVGCTTKTVDLARDVLKFVPIYWAAELVGSRGCRCLRRG